jgi:phosphoribosylformylglycinamidine cyclo-ligase
MSHDDPTRLEQIVKGVSDGCIEADVALLGGETAIMPDLYARGDYDLAGFCVGVVEKAQVIDGSAIRPGDIVLGIASSGLHSNGYSLVRKIVFELVGLGVDDPVPGIEQTVGELLLTPTRIYTKAVRSLQCVRNAGQLHGIAHITGGGLLGNLERIIPAGSRAQIVRGSWEILPVFNWLQGLGGIDNDEMDRVFNMGVGLVLVIDPAAEDAVRQQLEELKLPVWKIGKIAAGEQGAVWA